MNRIPEDAPVDAAPPLPTGIAGLPAAMAVRLVARLAGTTDAIDTAALDNAPRLDILAPPVIDSAPAPTPAATRKQQLQAPWWRKTQASRSRRGRSR